MKGNKARSCTNNIGVYSAIFVVQLKTTSRIHRMMAKTHNGKSTSAPPMLRAALMLFMAFFLVACERVEDVNFRQGYSAGFEQGTKSGYQEGYRAAYDAVHPGTRHGYSKPVEFAHKIFAALGAIKIIFAIVVFCFVLVERSKSNEEIAAKLLFALVGAIAAFFTAPLLGMQGVLSGFLLWPSPASQVTVWLVIIISAAVGYFLARVCKDIFQYVRGIWLEVWSIFCAAGIGTVLAQVILNIFFYSPDINDFLASNILLGVFVGTLMFVAVELVNRAAAARSE